MSICWLLSGERDAVTDLRLRAGWEGAVQRQVVSWWPRLLQVLPSPGPASPALPQLGADRGPGRVRPQLCPSLLSLPPQLWRDEVRGDHGGPHVPHCCRGLPDDRGGAPQSDLAPDRRQPGAGVSARPVRLHLLFPAQHYLLHQWIPSQTRGGRDQSPVQAGHQGPPVRPH